MGGVREKGGRDGEGSEVLGTVGCERGKEREGRERRKPPCLTRSSKTLTGPSTAGKCSRILQMVDCYSITSLNVVGGHWAGPHRASMFHFISWQLCQSAGSALSQRIHRSVTDEFVNVCTVIATVTP